MLIFDDIHQLLYSYLLVIESNGFDIKVSNYRLTIGWFIFDVIPVADSSIEFSKRGLKFIFSE